ncbi:hypothetical protein V5O48_015946 [Marasmius crinis-equi]|uniref:Uncharacterized protein n=1 Tax=Marasmius crinis-equi TaxID=585013 RepID=A0ABR3ET64_9AGAR
MSTRQLKRNISNDPQNDPTFKKPKTRKNPLQSKFPSHFYETPHPTSQSQSEVYKLPSSVGEPVSPSDFSPIPKKTVRKTSSTNLKENAGKSPFGKERFNKKKYGKSKNQKAISRALESPFIPSSPVAGGGPDEELFKKSMNQHVLSSTGHDPNVPAHTAQIPARIHVSPFKSRRPSAPTPPRKSDWDFVQTNNGSAVDLGLGDTTVSGQAQNFNDQEGVGFGFPRSSNRSIDFNRPPSQLSLYDYNRSATYDDPPREEQEGFFAGIRDESTPFKLPSFFDSQAQARGAGVLGALPLTSRQLREVSDTDTDSDSCGWDSDEQENMRSKTGSDSIFQSLKLASRTRARSSDGSGYVTPSAEDSEDDEDTQRSPWIEDSLISAPNTRDWRAMPLRRGYMRDVQGEKDVEMADGDVPESLLQGISHSLNLGGEAGLAKKSESPSNSRPAGSLQLPSLTRPEGPPATILRTRSLGDNEDLPSNTVAVDVTTAHNTTSQPPPSYARRTRSGTVVASATSIPALAPALPVLSSVFRRTRSGTVVSGKVDTLTGTKDASANSIVPVSSNIPPRRTRSGTVVLQMNTAAPSDRDMAVTSASVGGTGTAFGSRRSRSGSIQVAPSLSSVGEAGDSALRPPPPTVLPTRRSRSGSIAALANTVGAKLASLPLPGTGMLGRTRSGTVVRAPTLPPVENPLVLEHGDVEMELVDAGAGGRGDEEGSNVEGSGSVPGSSPDPLDCLPNISANCPRRTGAEEGGTSSRPRLEGLRSRKAAGRGMGKAKPRSMSINAMDVDGDGRSSEDELLLKPGDRFS